MMKVATLNQIDEDDKVLCKLCHKSFAIQMALNNHVKMFHEDIFVTGDIANWTEYVKLDVAKEEPKIKTENKIISQTANSIISQVSFENLTSLASSDIKYVIIKAEDIDQEQLKEATKRVKKKPEPATVQKEKRTDEFQKEKKVSKKRVYVKKNRDVRQIPGPFVCTELNNYESCNQTFSTCCEYSIHFRDDHKRKKKSNKCQVCERLLLPNFIEDGSAFYCKECGLGFQIESEMKNHYHTAHPKIRPFKCGVCGKKFTQKAILLQHMRLHTGQKPFICPHCDKSFTQKSTLCQHLRIHTNDKPYRCVVCNRHFTQYGILRQHMRTHTNIAPFQCQLCQKKFKQSRPLSNHMERFHSQSEPQTDPPEYQISDGENQEYLLEIPVEGGANIMMDPSQIKNEVIEVETCDDEEFVLLEQDANILECEVFLD